MPKPIVCLSTALCQFAELFRPCFSQRQWKYFVIVLLGLTECEGRRTLSGLLAVVGEQVSLCGLSRFFSRWQWSATAVAQTWLRHFQTQMQPLVEADHQRQCRTGEAAGSSQADRGDRFLDPGRLGAYQAQRAQDDRPGATLFE